LPTRPPHPGARLAGWLPSRLTRRDAGPLSASRQYISRDITMANHRTWAGPNLRCFGLSFELRCKNPPPNGFRLGQEWWNRSFCSNLSRDWRNLMWSRLAATLSREWHRSLFACRQRHCKILDQVEVLERYLHTLPSWFKSARWAGQSRPHRESLV
jgi:hypothetical protein